MSEPIFENDFCTIYFPQEPLSEGHIILEPKNIYQSVDEINAEEFVQYCEMANVCASILFEELQSPGTNILIRDGPNSGSKNVLFEIIARFENDGLNFLWEPKQIDQSEFEQIAQKIKDSVIIGETKQQKPATQQKTEQDDISQNLFYRELNRLP